MSTSEKLKIAIEKENISYGELSKITGIPKTTIQRYAVGTTKKIPIEAIQKLEIALGLKKGYLMGWDEKIPPEKSEEIEEGIVLHRDGKTSTYRMSKDKLKTIEALLEQLDEDDNPDL